MSTPSEVIDKAVKVGGARHKAHAHRPSAEKADPPLQSALVQGLQPNDVLDDLQEPPAKPDAPRQTPQATKEHIVPKHSKNMRAKHQINQPMAKSFGGGK